jgi:hypothetical protein
MRFALFLRPGQPHNKGTPAPWFILELDSAAMRFGRRLDDRQPQPAVGVRIRPCRAEKRSRLAAAPRAESRFRCRQP